jgi:hypothetical protein
MEPVTLITSSQIYPSSFDDDAWMIAVLSATGRPAPRETGNTTFRVNAAASVHPTEPTARQAPTSFRQRIFDAVERARLQPDMPTTCHG